MNKLAIASLVAASTTLVGTPRSARAGDEVWAAIGGFVGGVIVGNAIAHKPPPPRYAPPCPVPAGARIVIESGPAVRGYWGWVEVRAWVPGYWTFAFDRRGRQHSTWVSGYYEVRRERVWVDLDHRGHRRPGGYRSGY